MISLDVFRLLDLYGFNYFEKIKTNYQTTITGLFYVHYGLTTEYVIDNGWI